MSDLYEFSRTLSQIGRFVEAVAYWDKALDFIPDFSMARGNRGAGLVHYAHSLYDDAHALIFFRHAYDDLESALKKGWSRMPGRFSRGTGRN